MRWLVVRASPPLSCRPSFVAHAQPPGPGLPEHAPSVHTSSAPSTADMSGRGAERVGRAATGLGCTDPDGADSAHPTCAHPLPDFAISSPGRTGEAQTAQVVAYLAVIGTRRTLSTASGGPDVGERVTSRARTRLTTRSRNERTRRWVSQTDPTPHSLGRRPGRGRCTNVVMYGSAAAMID